MTILLGTADGLRELGGGTRLAGHEVHALSRPWALADHQVLFRDDEKLARVDRGVAHCILPIGDDVLVGTSEAHLLRLTDGALVPVDAFDAVEGRDEWYTPWGAPADVRSLTRTDAGTLLANVHVGGVVRSTDRGATWTPTIDIDADVHQVLAADGSLVVAAAAVGLCVSDDDGATWRIVDEGLHATYCRAVAVAGDTVVVSASTGPGGQRSALYRRPLSGDAPFERCVDGLPEWFGGNVDSFCVGASGSTVVCGAPGGVVYVSEDGGASWSTAESGLPAIRVVAVS